MGWGELHVPAPNPFFAGLDVAYDKDCPEGMIYLINPHHLVMSSTAFRKRHRVWSKPWTWLRRNTYEAPWVVQAKAMSMDDIVAKYGG